MIETLRNERRRARTVVTARAVDSPFPDNVTARGEHTRARGVGAEFFSRPGFNQNNGFYIFRGPCGAWMGAGYTYVR